MKSNFSKLIVILVVLLNTAYVVAALAILAIKGYEPTILTGAWFGFTTGELWLLANLKKAKVNKEERLKEDIEYELPNIETKID